MSRVPKSELTEAEKLAIQLWIQTGNASYAYEQAYPGKYEDHKDATQRMKKLLMKPLANEYQQAVRAEIEQKVNISKEWLLDEIVALKEESRKNMDYSSSVKCLFLIAKMMGYMSKQVVDVKKSITISFGGNFNPEKMIEAEILAPDQLPSKQTEYISLDNFDKIEVKEEDKDVSTDNAKIDEF